VLNQLTYVPYQQTSWESNRVWLTLTRTSQGCGWLPTATRWGPGPPSSPSRGMRRMTTAARSTHCPGWSPAPPPRACCSPVPWICPLTTHSRWMFWIDVKTAYIHQVWILSFFGLPSLSGLQIWNCRWCQSFYLIIWLRIEIIPMKLMVRLMLLVSIVLYRIFFLWII